MCSERSILSPPASAPLPQRARSTAVEAPERRLQQYLTRTSRAGRPVRTAARRQQWAHPKHSGASPVYGCSPPCAAPAPSSSSHMCPLCATARRTGKPLPTPFRGQCGSVPSAPRCPPARQFLPDGPCAAPQPTRSEQLRSWRALRRVRSARVWAADCLDALDKVEHGVSVGGAAYPPCVLRRAVGPFLSVSTLHCELLPAARGGGKESFLCDRKQGRLQQLTLWPPDWTV